MSENVETIRQCGDEKSQCGDAGKFRIDEMFSTPPPQDENDVETSSCESDGSVGEEGKAMGRSLTRVGGEHNKVMGQ